MSLPKPPWSGLLDDRFEYIKSVDKGSFSEVFQAKDMARNQIIAVKVLTKVDGRLRFEREIELLQKIHHKHVVGYIHHGKLDAEHPYVALEWLQGENLQVHMDRGRLRIEDAVRLIMEAAEGLGELHRLNIVQRDIKPANIFVCTDLALSTAKIIDLGIARDHADRTITRAGALLGTPYYLSPELATAEFRVGPPSDVFGLGSVLYELVTSRKPYDARQLWELLGKIIFETPKPPREHAPQISEDLEKVILKALSKDPHKRFRNGKAFALALREVSTNLRGSITEYKQQDRPQNPQKKPAGVLLLELKSLKEKDLLDDHLMVGAVKRVVERHGGVFTTIPGNRLLVMFEKKDEDEDEVARAVIAGLDVLKNHQGKAAVTAGRFGLELNPWEALNKASALLRRAPGRPGIWVDFLMARKLKDRFELTDEAGGHLVTGPI